MRACADRRTWQASRRIGVAVVLPLIYVGWVVSGIHGAIERGCTPNVCNCPAPSICFQNLSRPWHCPARNFRATTAKHNLSPQTLISLILVPLWQERGTQNRLSPFDRLKIGIGPPNAALPGDADGKSHVLIIEISASEINGGTSSYSYDVIQGDEIPSLGNVVIFIDSWS